MKTRYNPTSLQFGFYTEKEIESISVAEITLPFGFDSFNHPVPNGLYDPRLGPINEKYPFCPTCSMSFHNCPGHFGHISLKEYVFNPISFDLLYLLLNSFCQTCNYFKITPKDRLLFYAELTLLRRGHLFNSRLKDLDEEEDVDRIFEVVTDVLSGIDYCGYLPSEHHKSVSDFLKRVSVVKKCVNCHSRSVNFKKNKGKLITLDGSVILPRLIKDKLIQSCIIEEEILALMFDGFSIDNFFMRYILVTPNKFRPVSYMNNSIFESPYNLILSRIIKFNVGSGKSEVSGDKIAGEIDESPISLCNYTNNENKEIVHDEMYGDGNLSNRLSISTKSGLSSSYNYLCTDFSEKSKISCNSLNKECLNGTCINEDCINIGCMNNGSINNKKEGVSNIEKSIYKNNEKLLDNEDLIACELDKNENKDVKRKKTYENNSNYGKDEKKESIDNKKIEFLNEQYNASDCNDETFESKCEKSTNKKNEILFSKEDNAEGKVKKISNETEVSHTSKAEKIKKKKIHDKENQKEKTVDIAGNLVRKKEKNSNSIILDDLDNKNIIEESNDDKITENISNNSKIIHDLSKSKSIEESDDDKIIEKKSTNSKIIHDLSKSKSIEESDDDKITENISNNSKIIHDLSKSKSIEESDDIKNEKITNKSGVKKSADNLKCKGDKPEPIFNIRDFTSLQKVVEIFFDSTHSSDKDMSIGIKQKLERKEGLFRRHMMGKRVNFAARSVISPDPHLHTREIGIPLVFAEALTFPESVHHGNYKAMYRLVVNGPKYPGARHLTIKNPRFKNSIKYDLYTLTERKRTELANRLLFRESIVHRHLVNDDIVLVNRQPTLHKPSIMSHRVRVLPGEKTIRMHYANCNSYNADFDGDEMNVHFLQDHLSRSEGYLCMSTDHNYLSSTNGDPVRGLVQDHIVVCARLCLVGEFMQREEFIYYISASVYLEEQKSCFLKHESSSLSDESKNINEKTKGRYYIPKPTIIRPVVMYTGKQVISSILRTMNIKIDHTSKSKMKNLEDGLVIIRDGILLVGVLDKNQIGPTKDSLVQVCGEKYGYSICNELLTSFGRVISRVMMRQGYSARLDDLILEEKWNNLRKDVCIEGEEIAIKASHGVLFKEDETNFNMKGENVDLEHKEVKFDLVVNKGKKIVEKNFNKHIKGKFDKSKEVEHQNNLATINKTIRKSNDVNVQENSIVKNDNLDLEIKRKTKCNLVKNFRKQCCELTDPFYFIDSNKLSMFDSVIKSAMNEVTSKIYQNSVSNGQFIPFPYNNMSLMVNSGAKGSMVNLGQISGLLGQQELEGKRVPYMISGTTLPCFPSCDVRPQVSGYIFGRFLDGINPSEYFFHCMAGREGLIDTAVKTSRSGYLQRCLIKSMEGIVVEYDMSVRNEGDIVQFIYGEDGCDTTKTTMKKSLMSAYNKPNKQSYNNEYTVDKSKNDQKNNDSMNSDKLKDDYQKNNYFMNPDKLKDDYQKDDVMNSNKFKDDYQNNDVMNSNKYNDYQNDDVMNPNKLKDDYQNNDAMNSNKFNDYQENNDAMNANKSNQCQKNNDKYSVIENEFIQKKLLSYYGVSPGEAVGVLAAQGIGEPSTQMTLNTFHLAGVGSKNVTLGIPRLVEILMVASKNIKTPVINVKLQDLKENEKRPRIRWLPKKILKMSFDERKSYIIETIKKKTLVDIIKSIKIEEKLNNTFEIELTFKERIENLKIKRIMNKLIEHHIRKLDKLKYCGIEIENCPEEPDSIENDKITLEKDDDESSDVESETEEKEISKNKNSSITDYKEIETENGDEDENLNPENEKKDDTISSEDSISDVKDSKSNELILKNDRVESKNTTIENDHTSSSDNEVIEKKQRKKYDVALKKIKLDKGKSKIKVTENNLFNELDGVKGEKLESYRNEDQDSSKINLRFRMVNKNVLILPIIEKILPTVVIKEFHNIKGGSIVDDTLLIEGSDFNCLIDLISENEFMKTYSNDIDSVLTTFGVEACRSVIISEIKAVFDVYGIAIDVRHLMLIADFMTREGYYKPFSRFGMSYSKSVLQKMSFESCFSFLKEGALFGTIDSGENPSSSLVLGNRVKVGTGKGLELFYELEE